MKEGNGASTTPRVIVITGFMGAGKTTVARALALRLSCALIDLDDFIVEREGRTPRQIIEEDGEARFREVETRALLEALERAQQATKHSHPTAGRIGASSSGSHFVVATGGGAWTIERNRALVAAHEGFAVWLDAPFELCWRRINEDDAATRPLARDEDGARRLYEERRAAYQMGTLRVRVSAEKGAAALAAEIINALSS